MDIFIRRSFFFSHLAAEIIRVGITVIAVLTQFALTTVHGTRLTFFCTYASAAAAAGAGVTIIVSCVIAASPCAEFSGYTRVFSKAAFLTCSAVSTIPSVTHTTIVSLCISVITTCKLVRLFVATGAHFTKTIFRAGCKRKSRAVFLDTCATFYLVTECTCCGFVYGSSITITFVAFCSRALAAA